MMSDRPEPRHMPAAEDRGRLIRALRETLGREPAVRVAFLFGSVARGEPFRDVDIGVELAEPFRLLEVAALSNRLWVAAGRPSCELDVVPLNDAPPEFRLRVADEGIALAERIPGLAEDFAVQALSEKADLEETLRILESEETEAMRGAR